MSLLSRIFFQRKKADSVVVREVDVPGHGALAVMRSLDCMGAHCPRPQLFAMKVLEELRVGDVIEVMSDNPTSVEGFPFLAQALNCDYLATARDEGCWRVYLRKC